jgi:U3 small nucleolar RNA-associated protein 14
MARLSKNQRSSNPPVSSRPSTFKRRTNHLRNITRSDVYEYQSHKVRRAHISLALDKDEAHEHGAASDDDTDSNTRKPRLIGENVEDEDVPSEDDEELDSDAAFEESDEERFAGFSFPKVRCSPSPLYNANGFCNQSRGKTSRKGPVKDEDIDSPEIDDNDDDNSMDSEEIGDTRDYINVLDVFDGRADDSTEEALPANHAHVESQGSGLSANTDVNEENDTEAEEGAREEEESDSMLSADEDVNPSALEGLEKFVTSLETSKKRKGDSNSASNSLPRKRRLMEERTAVGIEGEFTAVASGTSVLSLSGKLFSVFSGQQLRLDDLLAPLASHSAAGLSITKTVKILDSSRTRGAPLSAPLPQRTQDRLDREAAYEQTKTEVDKWNETMKQIKEVMLILRHLILADLLTQRLSISLFHCKENQWEKYPILNLRRSSR